MKYYIVLLAAIIAAWSSVAQGNCPPRWTEWNGHCYRYLNQRHKNWTAASDHCKTESPQGNGHLITVDSTDEQKFARDWWVNMLNPLTGELKRIWTGIKDIGEGGKFIWSDGSPVTYTNWNGKQPNLDIDSSNCATLTVSKHFKQGNWEFDSCSERYAYMCEYTCTTCAKNI